MNLQFFSLESLCLKKASLFAISLLLYANTGIYSQSLVFENGGVNVGLSFNIGTTIERIGLYLGSFYYYCHFQLNTSIRVYYNFETFGPSIKGVELQPSAGLIASFGESLDKSNPFFTVLGNQAKKKYAVGYAYNAYFDKAKTSQRSGTILLAFGNFEFITENDILGARKHDRFRTGGVKVTYLYNQMAFGLSSILWTGNPSSPLSKRIHDSNFPSRYGYIDFSEAPYGKYSHGILAFQYKYALGLGQEIQVAAGVDSEKVRNIIQNRLIHDMYFWPRRWNKAKNPHLPMLDANGKPYLYQPGQKLKPSSLYLDFSLNPPLFY